MHWLLNFLNFITRYRLIAFANSWPTAGKNYLGFGVELKDHFLFVTLLGDAADQKL